MSDVDKNRTPGASYWDDVHRALSPGNDGKYLPKFELGWHTANEVLGRWSWALEVAFVGAITLLAFWLRFFDIASLPSGVHGDEAWFGIDALNFISGEHRGMWTGSALGNPGGYAWLVALSFTIGETNVTWLRMVSVLSGTMLVPVGYMLVRQVIGRDVALLSSIMIAASSWLIFQSRIAYQMIVVVFVITLSMYLLFEAVKRRDIVIAILGGLVFGAGLYTFKAYLIFFAAMTGLFLLLTYLPTELRRRREAYVYLIGAFLIGAPLLIFYVESGYIVQNYTDFYVKSSSLSVSDLLSRSAEVFLYFKNPIGDGGVDGAPSAPLLLNLFAQVAFALGVATIVLFIKHRPYQLVVLAFLVAMAPAVLTLDAESRRFLLGIMFLLIIASIGVRSLVIAAWVVTSKVLSDTDTNRVNSDRTKNVRSFVAIAAVIVIPFLALYLVDSRQHIQDWRDSEGGLDWYFEPDYFSALQMIDDLDDDYRVVSFSARRHANDHRIEFLFPNLETVEGASEHGGPGAIDIEMVNGNTAFLLFGDYTRLSEGLEALFPNQTKIVRYSDDYGRPHREHWYTAYLVGDG